MLTTSLVGLDAFDARISNIQVALDIPGLLDELGAAMLARTRARFLQQVDPDGVPWIPSLSAIRRALHGNGGGTLYDTGTLFHSIQLFLVDPNTRGIGTDVPYAIKHQEGQDGNVRRVFLGFGDSDTAAAHQITNDRIARILDKGTSS